jgi:hypothetical protein
MDGVVAEEGDVALPELGPAAGHDALRGPPVEGVVLLAAVDPDGGPHPVVVGEDPHAGRPDHLDDRELRGDVEPLDLGPLGRQRPGHGRRVGDGPGEDLLDGEAGSPSATASTQSAMKRSRSNMGASWGRWTGSPSPRALAGDRISRAKADTAAAKASGCSA